MPASASFGGLKGRDVRVTLRSQGFEEGTAQCLTKLAEYQTVIRESQLEMAQMLQQIVGIVENFATISGEMHKVIEATARKDSEVSDEQIGD